jgi:hypothetical protein
MGPTYQPLPSSSPHLSLLSHMAPLLHSSTRAWSSMLHSSPCSCLHSHRSQICRLPLNHCRGEMILKGEEHPLDRQPWPGERTRSRGPGCSVRSPRVAIFCAIFCKQNNTYFYLALEKYIIILFTYLVYFLIFFHHAWFPSFNFCM